MLVRIQLYLNIFFYLSNKLLEGGKTFMSLLTARGEEAKKSATEKKIDFDKVFIRLKDGDSVRVRLLEINPKTVGEYKAHNHFQKKIFTTPCVEPAGMECPYCVAANSGVEGWEKFYARKRYLISFYDIDAGEVRVWDATKQHGETILKLMEEYDESKDDMPFTFKRTGSGPSDTTYNLIPILKLDEKGKELFEAGANVEIPDDFFDKILVPRTREQMIENLRKAGFPVEDFFEDAVKADTNGDEEPEPIGVEADIANM
jgi:hypothetical protein